jgi:hypothetical protein
MMNEAERIGEDRVPLRPPTENARAVIFSKRIDNGRQRRAYI